MAENKAREASITLWSSQAQQAEFKNWLASHGFKNSQAIPALLEILKLSDAREMMPERGAEIDNFQDLLKKVLVVYQNSLMLAENAEDRIRNEFLDRIKTNEAAIASSKAKVDALTNERDTAKQVAQELQKKLDALEKELEAKMLSLQEKESVIEDKNSLLNTLRARMENDAKIVNEANVLKGKFDDLEKQVLELQKENLTLKQQAVTSDVQKLILNNRDHDALLKNFHY